MPDHHTSSLLVNYYDTYLRDQDLDSFRLNVTSRYAEGTLTRLLQAPDTQARRAALLALGITGGFTANAAVARALRDPDPTVRSLADMALWAIWFRADTPENNLILEDVRSLNSRQRYEDAHALATKLIERSPGFAEAYNQRAIASFFLGRFEESAADCRDVIKRNPYHVGAFSGLAECLVRLDRGDEAIKVLRRASRVQPHNLSIIQRIKMLEAGNL